MTGRDRIVAIGMAILVVLAAAWLLVVSPERKQAAKLDSQVSAANAQLVAAESQAASAQGAQAQYAAAYASIVSLGKAVPPGQEVPSLMYQLAQASNHRNVDFSSIVFGAGSGSNAAATPVTAATGFTQMPFTFTFSGSFPDLYHLFQQLNRFTIRTASGGLQVSGRLLTIQSVKLAPGSSPGAAQGSGTGAGQLTGTVTATAYVLPSTQGLTGAATATSPTGAQTPAASTSPAPSSPTPPAIARVSP
jgi:Tfp pilus assembly protein PilO